MQDAPKAVWSIPYVFVAFFPSLKQNFIAYRSSKMSSRPYCISEIHQLWQSGFSRVYSNYCCSCSFEAEIIKIGQSPHKMYSNNVLNSQESTTILNACTKERLKTYWRHHISLCQSYLLTSCLSSFLSFCLSYLFTSRSSYLLSFYLLYLLTSCLSYLLTDCGLSLLSFCLIFVNFLSIIFVKFLSVIFVKFSTVIFVNLLSLAFLSVIFYKLLSVIFGDFQNESFIQST